MSRADVRHTARLVAAAVMTAAWFGIAATPSNAQEMGGAMAQPAPDQIKLGESIFQGKAAGGTCWACHGKNAKGTAQAPDLTDKAWLNTDGTWEGIQDVVINGVPKPKKHSVPMAPMGGGKLSPEEVKAVAAYVYSLTQKKGKN